MKPISNFEHNAQLNYRKKELQQVEKESQFARTLQIKNENGSTKWLSITQEEFEQIKLILTK